MDRLKILIVSEGIAPVGGIATYMKLLARNFQARGHRVECLTTNYRGEGFAQLSKSVLCHDLSHIPLTWRKPIKAARLINQIHPEVVIGNHCSLLQYSLPLIKRPTRTITVLHSDDPRFYQTASRNRRHVFRWVAPSPALSSAFKGYISSREAVRVRTIPHAVDDAEFFSRAQESPRQEQVAFVGYIAENKGADLLPRVMTRVVAQNPNTILQIIGYGPLEATLKREFAQLGLTGNINFTGPINPHELGPLLRSSRVLLSPTRIEGFGLAIAEAMMCGVVPVVTRLPDITDQIVEEGVSGFLCSPNDVSMFADRINLLLSEHSQWQEFSRSATDQAAKRFSVRRAVDAYESLFREPFGPYISGPNNVVIWAVQTLLFCSIEKLKRSRYGRWANHGATPTKSRNNSTAASNACYHQKLHAHPLKGT